jgi:adenylate cyclase
MSEADQDTTNNNGSPGRNGSADGNGSEGRDSSEWEYELRRQIEDYYLPRQLVNAIFEHGGIPKRSYVTTMGIAFLDVADYTYMSKFLSPQENQQVLNGLYAAFNSVLKRHGGYLNKIEGDSVMFHYGGLTDAYAQELEGRQLTRYIAKELFYTCVEMQRVTVLFNQANDRFLYEHESQEARQELERAFDIVSTLRSMTEIASLNALFQIRVRIGASMGEVTLGNFGPDGAKQWDVVGLPVINAKRMETTAPVGGLRISEELYDILEETGVADDYFHRFQKEAQALFGYYRDISKEELFQFNQVSIREKKGAGFRTYSVQVNPGLPEAVQHQVELLLQQGRSGADRIVDFLQYYRGNRFVIRALEEVFRRSSISLRKSYLFSKIYPKKHDALANQFGKDQQRIDDFIDGNFSLFDLLQELGRYQDTVKQNVRSEKAEPSDFEGYDVFMEACEQSLQQDFDRSKRIMVEKAYFYNVVFPLVFESIRSSILEYQDRLEDVHVLA